MRTTHEPFEDDGVTYDSRVARVVAIGFLEDWARLSIKAFEAAGLIVTDPDDYPCPHEPESGCPSCAPDEPCEHHCQSGVDDTPLGDPDKVWRCDECGVLLCESADPEVAAEMSDTHLLVKGERYSFRCACGCNVFKRLNADLFKCNGCGERYESA